MIPRYASLFTANPATQVEIQKLKEAVASQLTSERSTVVSAAALALKQFNDVSLAPVLRACLHQHFRTFFDEYVTVANLIVALEYSNEEVSTEGFNIVDIEKNVSDVRRYLKRFGLSEHD